MTSRHNDCQSESSDCTGKYNNTSVRNNNSNNKHTGTGVVDYEPIQIDWSQTPLFPEVLPKFIVHTLTPRRVVFSAQRAVELPSLSVVSQSISPSGPISGSISVSDSVSVSASIPTSTHTSAPALDCAPTATTEKGSLTAASSSSPSSSSSLPSNTNESGPTVPCNVTSSTNAADAASVTGFRIHAAVAGIYPFLDMLAEATENVFSQHNENWSEDCLASMKEEDKTENRAATDRICGYRVPPMPQMKECERDFNREFQRACERPAILDTNNGLTTGNVTPDMNSVYNDFVSFSTAVAVRVARERLLPKDERTIKCMADKGDLTGSEKFVVGKVTFKIVRDSYSLYGDDMYAAKIAASEVRHMNAILKAIHVGGAMDRHIHLNIVPTAVIICGGYTIQATAIAPFEGDETLRYGSLTAGHEFRTADLVVCELAPLCQYFGLAPHSLSGHDPSVKALTAVDVQVHASISQRKAPSTHDSGASASDEKHVDSTDSITALVTAAASSSKPASDSIADSTTSPRHLREPRGCDGRLYLTNLGRFLPCTPPHHLAPIEFLYNIFRPEFMLHWTEVLATEPHMEVEGKIVELDTLSSDSYSKFELEADSVMSSVMTRRAFYYLNFTMVDRLCCHVASEASSLLEDMSDEHGVLLGSELIGDAFHKFGVNMRLLWTVRDHFQRLHGEDSRLAACVLRSLETEILCRSVKQLIRSGLKRCATPLREHALIVGVITTLFATEEEKRIDTELQFNVLTKFLFIVQAKFCGYAAPDVVPDGTPRPIQYVMLRLLKCSNGPLRRNIVETLMGIFDVDINHVSYGQDWMAAPSKASQLISVHTKTKRADLSFVQEIQSNHTIVNIDILTKVEVHIRGMMSTKVSVCGGVNLHPSFISTLLDLAKLFSVWRKHLLSPTDIPSSECEAMSTANADKFHSVTMEATTIATKCYDRESRELAEFYVELGLVLQHYNDFDQAVIVFEAALAIFLKAEPTGPGGMSHSSRSIAVLQYLVILCGQFSKTDEAIAYLTQTVALASAMSSRQVINQITIPALQRMAEMHQASGNYAEALEFFGRVEELYQQDLLYSDGDDDGDGDGDSGSNIIL
jgi:Clustered mitochondria